VVAALQGGAHEPPPPPPPPALVVTLTELLCADIPNESLAATLKLYVVEAAKPETVKVVAVGGANEIPFSKDGEVGVAQFAGGGRADKLSVVPDLVVAEAERPLGALGLAEQEPPPPPPEHGPRSDQSAGVLGGSQPLIVVYPP